MQMQEKEVTVSLGSQRNPGALVESISAVNACNDSKVPSILKETACFLLICWVLLLSYSSVLFSTFGFREDYSLLWGHATSMPVLMASARPVWAYIHSPIFGRLAGVGDLWYLRLVTIVGFAVFGFVLYRFFSRKGWP